MHDFAVFNSKEQQAFLTYTCLLSPCSADAILPQESGDEQDDEETEDEEVTDADNATTTSPFHKDFAAKYKKRMAKIKNRSIKTRDMNILVVSRPMASLSKTIVTKNPLMNKNMGTQKLMYQLEKKEGTLEFVTGGFDGHVEICVQSLSATKVNPSRIALNVAIRATADPNAVVDQPKNEPPLVLDPTAMLTFATSGITDEMSRLHGRMREIVSNAEYSRDVEVSFHQQSVALNKAVRYWPAFRIFILVVAGCIQVSSVLGYMKSRHYI